jgi:hypothetical protein
MSFLPFYIIFLCISAMIHELTASLLFLESMLLLYVPALTGMLFVAILLLLASLLWLVLFLACLMISP